MDIGITAAIDHDELHARDLDQGEGRGRLIERFQGLLEVNLFHQDAPLTLKISPLAGSGRRRQGAAASERHLPSDRA